MVWFREMFGTVYILENPEASRVKVGVTINNAVERLRALNDLWSGRTGTCQICGVRYVMLRGKTPEHLKSGRRCPGARESPLEKDAALAEWYLRVLQEEQASDSGQRKTGHATRIKRLTKLLALPRHADIAVGSWYLRREVFTERAEAAELRSHTYLTQYLDVAAPLGEVFSCSVEVALEAVERALRDLGLFEAARIVKHD